MLVLFLQTCYDNLMFPPYYVPLPLLSPPFTHSTPFSLPPPPSSSLTNCFVVHSQSNFRRILDRTFCFHDSYRSIGLISVSCPPPPPLPTNQTCYSPTSSICKLLYVLVIVVYIVHIMLCYYRNLYIKIQYVNKYENTIR